MKQAQAVPLPVTLAAPAAAKSATSALDAIRKYGGWLVVLALIVATLVVLQWHEKQVQFFCDDSYISYRYSQNLAAGHGLVYNVGERVEGYTNFLWVVLIAAGVKLGFAAEPVSLWLGLAFLIVTLGVTALEGRRLFRSWAFALVPALLLVCQGPMVLWSVSGLEASFFAAMTMAALVAFERARSSPKRLFVAGALYAVSTMVRPDGVVFGAAAGLSLVLCGLFARPFDLVGVARRALALALGFAAIFGPFVLWRHHYYDDWLPNTFYVKAGGRTNLTLGLDYVAAWARDYWVVASAAGAGLIAILLPQWRELRKSFFHYGLALLLFCAYLAWAGGDYMALYRFVVPLLPIAMLPATALLKSLFDLATRVRIPAPIAALTGLAVVAAGGHELVKPTQRSIDGDKPSKSISSVKMMKENSASWAAVGKAMKQKLPANITIATTAAGALPYFAEMATIDQSGLCDRHTAKQESDPWLLDRAGHMIQATCAYLDARKPELILWHPQIVEPGTPPRDLPAPLSQDYEMRAMAVPELAENGKALYCWVRKDKVEAFNARGIVAAREIARYVKPKAQPKAKESLREKKKADEKRAEEERAAAEAALPPPIVPPTIDPPLPASYDGPVFMTERVHAADPASDEPRQSVDNVTRPLWLAEGPAKVELTGAAGSYVEVDVASLPTADALAGVGKPTSVAIELERGGPTIALPTKLVDENAAAARRWHTLRADCSGIAAGEGTLVVKVDGTPAGRGSKWFASVPKLMQRADADARPNVLILTIDTLRADYLHCYGHDRPTSPNIDAFARQGVLFERAVSQACWTLPSYSSMFASLYSESTGVVHRDHKFAGHFVTFIEELARAGYATNAITSGTFTDAFWGFDQGFDSYDDLGMVVDDSNSEEQVAANGAAPMSPDAMQAAHRRITSPEVANKAIAWLDAHRDRRFALFVHFFDCHEDYMPHPGVSEKFPPRPVSDDFPNAAERWDESTAKLRALYEGEIAYTDVHVGRVLDRLEKLGLAKNTIVVLCADHGEAFKEHLYDVKNPKIGVGHGSSLYNEEVHVPMIFRAPGIAPGRVATPVGNLDIGPTLLELCGVTNAHWEPQGKSLAPMLKDKAVEREEPVLTARFLPMNPPSLPAEQRMQVGFRVDRGDLCAIQYEQPGGRPPLQLLFDWKNRWQDFAANLLDSAQEKFDQMANYYSRLRVQLQQLAQAATLLKIDEATRQRLAGFGYVDATDEEEPKKADAPKKPGK